MRWYLMRNSAHWLFSWVLAATLTAVSPAAMAQQAPQDKHELDEIVVVGVTPVPGFKVEARYPTRASANSAGTSASIAPTPRTTSTGSRRRSHPASFRTSARRAARAAIST
jgi:hypothetical protein